MTEEEIKELIAQHYKEKSESRVAEEIPAEISEKIAIGNTLIYPERQREWEKYVKANNGSELDVAIPVMEALENGASFEEASKIMENTNSIESFAMAMSIIAKFSKKGVEFFRYVSKDKALDPENEKFLQKISQENEHMIMSNAECINDTGYLLAGLDLDRITQLLEDLKNENKNVYINGYGTKLYSMLDNRDSCYKKVTGKTYEEFKNQNLENSTPNSIYENKLGIIKNNQKYMEGAIESIYKKSLNLIYPQRKDEWEKKCEESFKSPTIGKDFSMAVAIMEGIERNEPFEDLYGYHVEEKEYYFNKALNLIKNFAKKGVEFYKYAQAQKNKQIDEEELKRISQENEQFEKQLRLNGDKDANME